MGRSSVWVSSDVHEREYGAYFATRALYLDCSKKICFDTMLKQVVTHKENFASSEFCTALCVCLVSRDTEVDTKKHEYKSKLKSLRFESRKELKMFLKTLTGFGHLDRETQINLIVMLQNHLP